MKLELTPDVQAGLLAARFLLRILLAAAEFERELIRERAAAGLRRYRGTRLPRLSTGCTVRPVIPLISLIRKGRSSVLGMH